ncbi:MAG: hypothetical protein D6732_06235 [Methanobacteriota archaeon]|nr:MAG: hypothetical protein D6732_06235 [Euryarchaeota archaeon]
MLDFFLNEFYAPSILILAGIHLLILLISAKLDFSALRSLALSSFPMILMTLLFLQRAVDAGVNWYGEIMPLSILVTLFITEFMFFSSMQSYIATYSKTELWLSIFYATFLLNWLIIFVDHTLTIGSLQPENILFVRFAGSTMLNLALAEALALYFIGKYMFYPDYPYMSIFEPILFIVYGVVMGLNWGGLSNGSYFTPEAFHTYGFFFPEPFWLFGTITGIFVVVPQFLIAYFGRKYSLEILEDRTLLSSLDPYLVPRLRWIGRATYIFAIGVTLSFFILVGSFQFNVEFLAIFSPWIASLLFIMVSAIFYMAFQSPETLRKIVSK